LFCAGCRPGRFAASVLREAGSSDLPSAMKDLLDSGEEQEHAALCAKLCRHLSRLRENEERLEVHSPISGLLRSASKWRLNQDLVSDVLGACCNLGRRPIIASALVGSPLTNEVFRNAMRDFIADGDIVHSCAVLIHECFRASESSELPPAAKEFHVDSDTYGLLARGAYLHASSTTSQAAQFCVDSIATCLGGSSPEAAAPTLSLFVEGPGAFWLLRSLGEATTDSCFAAGSSAGGPGLRRRSPVDTAFAVCKAVSTHPKQLLAGLVREAKSLRGALVVLCRAVQGHSEVMTHLVGTVNLAYSLLLGFITEGSSRDSPSSELAKALADARRFEVRESEAASGTSASYASNLIADSSSADAHTITEAIPAKVVLATYLKYSLLAASRGSDPATTSERLEWILSRIARAAYNSECSSSFMPRLHMALSQVLRASSLSRAAS
jgi:hypothetical protein